MPCRLYSVVLLLFTFILNSTEREVRFESHRYYAVRLYNYFLVVTLLFGTFCRLFVVFFVLE